MGLAAWLAYGLTEQWFVSVLPRIIVSLPQRIETPTFTFLILSLYGAAGVVVGVCMGLVALIAVRSGEEGNDRIAFRLIGVLLIVACLVNGGRRLHGPSLVLLVVACLCATGLVMLSSAKGGVGTFAPAVALPLLVSFLLVAPLWMYGARRALPGRAFRAAAVIAAFLLVATIAVRLLRRRSAGRQGLGRRVVASWTAVLALTLVASVAFPDFRRFRTAPPPPSVVGRSGRPSVLLITMDTVRADHLGTYGYERDTTPILSRFADRADRYTMAISPADMTLPSHASLFTSRYALNHGAHFDPLGADDQLGMPLPPDATTLARLLARKGYRTISVVANHGYLGPAWGLGQGFAAHDYRSAASMGDPAPYMLRLAVVHYLKESRVLADSFAPPYRRADEITRAALDQIRAAVAAGDPFFAFINYMDAHRPYVPPAPYDLRFPGKDPTFRPERSHDRLYEQRQVGGASLSDRERIHLISQYDGALAYVDHEIGVLLSQLRAWDQFDRSLVIITSDHGECFGERGLLGHGISVYQDQVHVPLLVKLPSQKTPRVIRSPVSLVDVAPTILRLTGSEPPPSFEGIPLTTEASADRAIFSESYWNHNQPGKRRIQRTVVRGRWKYVMSTDGKRELFDLEADPREEQDEAPREAGVATQLDRTLLDWIASAERSASENRRPDEEAIRALRSLGYVR
jgi:arylsulfatase A-like enzyme